MSTVPPPPPYVQQPFEQRRSGCGCLWISLGVIGLLAALVCCGCGGMMLFGVNVGKDAIRQTLNENPVVREHVGEVQEAEFDWGAMFGGQLGNGSFAMKLKGDKGSAKVRLRNFHAETGTPTTYEGELILPSGEEIPLRAPEEGGEMHGDEEPPADAAPDDSTEPQPEGDEAEEGAVDETSKI